MQTANITLTGFSPAQAATLRTAAELAWQDWASHFTGDGVTDIALTARANIGGGVIAYVDGIAAYRQPGGIYRPAAAENLITGTNGNGSAVDIPITIDPAQIAGTDARAVLRHEIGHGLVFNGGASAPTPFSTLTVGGSFVGSAAQAINGGPVPLVGNHYAQAGLMNPYDDPENQRQVEALDLAFAADDGLPVREKFGTLGNDTMQGTPAADIAYGGYGNDTMQGNQGADTLYGWAGDDLLWGGKDADILIGGDGNDTLSGDLGNDTLTGGPGADLFAFGRDGGTDHITDFAFTLGGPSDRLQFASAPTVSVDFDAATATYRSAGTTVILDNCISVMPDLVVVA